MWSNYLEVVNLIGKTLSDKIQISLSEKNFDEVTFSTNNFCRKFIHKSDSKMFLDVQEEFEP